MVDNLEYFICDTYIYIYNIFYNMQHNVWYMFIYIDV